MVARHLPRPYQVPFGKQFPHFRIKWSQTNKTLKLLATGGSILFCMFVSVGRVPCKLKTSRLDRRRPTNRSALCPNSCDTAHSTRRPSNARHRSGRSKAYRLRVYRLKTCRPKACRPKTRRPRVSRPKLCSLAAYCCGAAVRPSVFQGFRRNQFPRLPI